MDNNGTLSASDVAMLSNGGFGGNSFLWIFALLILANGGFGGFGGYGNRGYQPQYATQDFVQNGFNFNDLQDQNRDLMGAITGGTAQAVAAVNQAKYDNIGVAKDIESMLLGQIGEVKVGQANQLANQNQCCSNLMRGIDGINYNAAMNTAAINATTTATGQKILDAIAGNRMADMQNQINALQLQNAMANVVRWPNTFSTPAPSPFCTCGNCGTNM